jgi:predicted phosphoribosyltransferase
MFHNRQDAAKQMAAVLRHWPLHQPLVLGIPRGGVVIGALLAEELGAELDVVLSRKLRAPDCPEVAIGAISEHGHIYTDERVSASISVPQDYLEDEIEFQRAQIESRRCLYRAVRPEAAISGRSVILADDGVATGSTMRAALESVRRQFPLELIVAVPVGPAAQVAAIKEHCDRMVCLSTPEDFCSVSQFYEDFPTVEDEEVVRILRNAAPLTEPGFV